MMEFPPEKWEPTLQLRWALREVINADFASGYVGVKVLQQGFKLISGKPEELNRIEWRDVPTVDTTK